MRGKCLPAAVATLAAFVCGVPAHAAELTPSEHALLAELNGTRAAYGLAPFRVDPSLERAARAHSSDMLRRSYFGHVGFSARVRRFGAVGPIFGENLAWGVGPGLRAAAIVRVWLGSPGHRANLLRPGFRRVGLAAPLGSFLGYRVARVVTLDLAGT